MTRIQGSTVFPGIAVGKAFWRPTFVASPDVPFRGEAVEIQALDAAVESAADQLRRLQESTARRLSATEGAIFEAHQMMLTDPEYLDAVRAEIGAGHPATAAVRSVTQSFVAILDQSSSPYLKERVADMKDVGARLQRNLAGFAGDDEILEPVILLADDLAPSDLMALADKPILGVGLLKGGFTSHTAILLKSMGIPSVFGLDGAESAVKVAGGGVAVLDAARGELLLDVEDATRERYEAAHAAEQTLAKELTAWISKATTLADGSVLPLVANVGNQNQLEAAVKAGAEGVGLYRTEFLFMDRATPPSEEEQVKLYRNARKTLGDRPLVIRTLDIGGDKKIPYLPQEAEENPFLGVRGLRLSLARRELFETQIRALLRASADGPLDVMFPMVTTPDEWDEAMTIVRAVRDSLPGVDSQVRWGMMIEVPVNLFIVPELAARAEFFSVGTNDLTQYLTAADRMNSHLRALSDPYSPGVLRAMAYLAREVRAAHRELSVCGEMAADPLLAPFLVGIGVGKLSMNPRMITRNRRAFSAVTRQDCEKLALSVVKQSDRNSVLTVLKNFASF